MSVLRCSTFMDAQNTRARNMKATMADTAAASVAKLFLAVAPIEVLDHQNAQAAEQMHREQEHQPAFGKFHQG